MSDSRSKFRKKFVTPTPKTDRSIVLKLLSVIHLPLKVDRFELLTDWSYIVCFMIDERTRCRNYITHLMINCACKGPLALISIDFEWNLKQFHKLVKRSRYSNRTLSTLNSSSTKYNMQFKKNWNVLQIYIYISPD